MAESTLISGDFTLITNSSSNLNGVIFHYVKAVYTAEDDIHCVYSITDEIEPDMDDFIGLFKFGSASSEECFSSVPARVPVNNDKQFLKTIFKAQLLPSDSSEMYQFCYISKKRIVGASTPFTFENSDIIAVEDPTDPGLLIFKSGVSQLKEELHKLSDEKTYYETKYRVLHSNFLKLKSEFDNLEQELQLERSNSKKLEESNNILTKQLKGKDADGQSSTLEEKPVALDLPRDVIKIECDMTLIRKENDFAISNALSEISNVIKKFLKDQEIEVGSHSYQDLVNSLSGILVDAKKKLQLSKKWTIDESDLCSCYFKQKASCVPSICSEAFFQSIFTQPLFVVFSNFCHFTEDGNLYCDGSFDFSSLREYLHSMMEIHGPEDAPLEQNREPTSEEMNIVEVENDTNVDIIQELNGVKLESGPDSIDQLNEERNKAVSDLKIANEKIASLTSRINVLELELVAQQSNHLEKSEVSSGRYQQNLTPSELTLKESVNTLDIESILECVHNEYISLKDKYRKISKKIAKTHSIEAKCSSLEEENAKLMQYFREVRDQNKKHSSAANQFCAELETIITEKNNAENKVISLQKECVGKISINLVQQHHQERA